MRYCNAYVNAAVFIKNVEAFENFRSHICTYTYVWYCCEYMLTPKVWCLCEYVLILWCTCYRRLCDEEDELNEVETETVPQEVREWLSLTFTRSTSNVKRRDSNDKVRFKSVAHAIRAGIVVER